MKYAIYSSDQNLGYLFFAPLTSLLWQKRISYSPVCIMVGDKEKWELPLNKFVLEKCLEVGTKLVFIEPVDGIQDSTVAQVSRLYGGCLDLNDDDYILTSDIDMWPLNAKWFHQDKEDKKFDLLFANAYGDDKYPMCFIGGKNKHWKEIMNISNDLNITENIKKQIYSDLGKNPDAGLAWNYDESLFQRKIKNFSGYPNNCNLINRNGQRIDRSDWSFNGTVNENLIDSHLLRPGHLAQNWLRLRALMDKLVSNEDLNWADRYWENFVKLI